MVIHYVRFEATIARVSRAIAKIVNNEAGPVGTQEPGS